MRNTGCGGRDFSLPHTELPPEASFPADGKATELPSDMQHTAKRYATRCQATSSKPFIGRLGAATYTYILMCKRLYKFFHKTFSYMFYNRN